jgi:hypothetical protein
MPYKVINQANSTNRKSRLNKELKRYQEYLEAVSTRSHQLIANLKEKSKAKQVKGGQN